MPAAPPPPESALAFYSREQRLVAAALIALRQRFPLFRAASIDASFARLLPELVAILASVQMLAARNAQTYVPSVLTELGLDAAAVAEIRPSAFVGASSGVSLETLFGSVPIEAKVDMSTGLDFGTVEERTASRLEGIMETQVADASRMATSVATTARPTVTGFIRMVTDGACGRCIVLAGRFYRYNADFERHPRCHCYSVPTTRDAGRSLGYDPTEYFHGLTKAAQDKAFGNAGAQAIREGADISRVVNATGRAAGMTSTVGGVKLTTEAAVGGSLRLTPEGIYRLASDRQEALRLLRANGYLI